MDKKSILKILVSNATKTEALEFILKGLAKREKKLTIFTPNPEIIVYANKHKAFRDILNSADLAIPDGIGVLLAGKIMGKAFKERIAGADLVEDLCSKAAKRAFTVGLMGGGPKIAERARDCLLQSYPRLKVVFAEAEWNQEKILSNEDIKILRQKKKKTKAPNILISQYPSIDILFVALGFPKQEQWIYENLSKIPVKVAMAVGGSFDYISGAVPRAPLFVREIGLEWFFRLLVQPWRIRRQLALLKFLFLVLKERLGK